MKKIYKTNKLKAKYYMSKDIYIYVEVHGVKIKDRDILFDVFFKRTDKHMWISSNKIILLNQIVK